MDTVEPARVVHLGCSCYATCLMAQPTQRLVGENLRSKATPVLAVPACSAASVARVSKARDRRRPTLRTVQWRAERHDGVLGTKRRKRRSARQLWAPELRGTITFPFALLRKLPHLMVEDRSTRRPMTQRRVPRPIAVTGGDGSAHYIAI